MEKIKKISKRIKEQLNRLNLTPEKPVDEYLANQITKIRYYYTTHCTKADGNEYLFKAQVVEDGIIERKFQNELVATLFLKKQQQLVPSIRIRDVYDWGLTSRINWAVYEYLEGENIKESDLDKLKISYIIKSLKALQSIDVSTLPPELYYFEGVSAEFYFKTKWWDNRYERYLKIIKQILEEIPCEKGKEILDFYKSNYEIMKYSPEVVSHGDFDLNNLLLYKNKIEFIDFEDIRVSNQAYDLANMFTRLTTDIRNEFIKEYIKDLKDQELEKFKILFRLMVIIHALGKIYPTIKLGETDKPIIKVWEQIIEKSLAGFNNLIS